MNREAVALAADSAVTIGRTGQKIFTSANKLFALSRLHPVGIMVYGSANLMQIPWETIIKIYRSRLARKKFNKLEQYADDFMEFLDNGNSLFPDSVQEDYARRTFYDYFTYLKEQVTKTVDGELKKSCTISVRKLASIVSRIISSQYEIWCNAKNTSTIPPQFNKKIVKYYNKIIDDAKKKVFEKLPLSKRNSDKLTRIAGCLFSRFPLTVDTANISGVVIAGFGELDTFPSVAAYMVECVVKNKLKYEKLLNRKISFTASAGIMPFAQREMVATFMEGIDPSFKDFEDSYITKMFSDYAKVIVDSIANVANTQKQLLQKKLVEAGKKILEDRNKELKTFVRDKFTDPVISVVATLPKDELAAMAESLVNLTSFKRRVTMERETVGGPIDVAVISKGDGFVWIKRKHYFKAELNPQFFEKNYRMV